MQAGIEHSRSRLTHGESLSWRGMMKKHHEFLICFFLLLMLLAGSAGAEGANYSAGVSMDGPRLRLGNLTVGAGYYSYQYQAAYGRLNSSHRLNDLYYRARYSFMRGSFLEAKTFSAADGAFKYTSTTAQALVNMSRRWGVGLYYKNTVCTDLDMMILQPSLNYSLFRSGGNSLSLSLNYENVRNFVRMRNYDASGWGGGLNANLALGKGTSFFVNAIWFPELRGQTDFTLAHTQANLGLTQQLMPHLSAQVVYTKDNVEGKSNLPLKVDVDGWGFNLLYRF
jgi:hypothetical protein